MTTFIQLMFSGLALGCDYALIALGFTIIFKASGVINFAQGEFLLVGTFVVSAGVCSPGSSASSRRCCIGMVVTALIGVLFERFVLRRMIGRPPFTIIMVTIGLDVLLLTRSRSWWAANTPASPAPFDILQRHPIGGVEFGSQRARDHRRDCPDLRAALRLLPLHPLWAGDARDGHRPGGGAGDGHQHLDASMRWPGASPAPSRPSAASFLGERGQSRL